MARHKTFDVERKVFNNRVGFSFDIIKAFGESGHTLLQVARRLKVMELSEEETSLMLALVTFFSGRSGRPGRRGGGFGGAVIDWWTVEFIDCLSD